MIFIVGAVIGFISASRGIRNIRTYKAKRAARKLAKKLGKKSGEVQPEKQSTYDLHELRRSLCNSGDLHLVPFINTTPTTKSVNLKRFGLSAQTAENLINSDYGTMSSFTKAVSANALSLKLDTKSDDSYYLISVRQDANIYSQDYLYSVVSSGIEYCIYKFDDVAEERPIMTSLREIVDLKEQIAIKEASRSIESFDTVTGINGHGMPLATPVYYNRHYMAIKNAQMNATQPVSNISATVHQKTHINSLTDSRHGSETSSNNSKGYHSGNESDNHSSSSSKKHTPDSSTTAISTTLYAGGDSNESGSQFSFDSQGSKRCWATGSTEYESGCDSEYDTEYESGYETESDSISEYNGNRFYSMENRPFIIYQQNQLDSSTDSQDDYESSSNYGSAQSDDETGESYDSEEEGEEEFETGSHSEDEISTVGYSEPIPLTNTSRFEPIQIF